MTEAWDSSVVLQALQVLLLQIQLPTMVYGKILRMTMSK
jgi:hypothetical protein